MRYRSIAFLVANLLAISASYAQGDDGPVPAIGEHLDDSGLEPDGTEIDTANPEEPRLFHGLVWGKIDSRLQLQVGSHFMYDYGHIDNNGDLSDAHGDDLSHGEVRDAVFSFSGQFLLKTRFKLQLEIESGEIDPGDIYVERDEIPGIGSLRIGHFVEPFSLERVTSLRHSTFMERSLSSSLAPGKSFGFMVSDTKIDQRLMWAIGLFRSTDTADDAADTDSTNVSARLTGLPVFAEGGRRLVHLGMSLQRGESGDAFRFRPRPESFPAPRYLDTGLLDIDSATSLNTEIAGVLGPLSIQGEYTFSWMENVESSTLAGGGEDLLFHGGYLQTSYFLTGEHRTYNHLKGAFGRTYPSRPFGLREGRRGPGAWEMAARISRIDLNDGSLRAGKEANFSLGLNWYLNESIRTSINYIRAAIDNDVESGNANIVQARIQFDFSAKEIGERKPLSRIRSRFDSES